jgi:transposase
MARGRKRKTEKGISNENDMKTAVQLVIEQNQSIRKAAERFGLKFQTVFEYVKRHNTQQVK